MKQVSNLKHYLLTIDVDQSMRMHGYLMCSNNKRKRLTERLTHQMLNTIEQQGLGLKLPIVLMTELSTGVDLVREVLCQCDPRTDEMLQEATNFHCSIWMMSTNHPDDGRLMQLH